MGWGGGEWGEGGEVGNANLKTRLKVVSFSEFLCSY